jgi:hypothetical protein
MTPEPKFKEATKMVNGEKKNYKVPKDVEKKILDLPSSEYEKQDVEILHVKKLRMHAKKAAESKQKQRDGRKNKRQKAIVVAQDEQSSASKGHEVAPIV